MSSKWLVLLVAPIVVALVTLNLPTRATNNSASSRDSDLTGTGTPMLTKGKFKLSDEGTATLKDKESITLTFEDVNLTAGESVFLRLIDDNTITIGAAGDLPLLDPKAKGKTFKSDKGATLGTFSAKATYSVKKRKLTIKLTKGTAVDDGNPFDPAIGMGEKDDSTVDIDVELSADDTAATDTLTFTGSFRVKSKGSKKDDSVSTKGKLEDAVGAN